MHIPKFQNFKKIPKNSKKYLEKSKKKTEF